MRPGQRPGTLHSMPLDAVSALTRLGGVATPRAVAHLASRRRLRTALAHGDVIRVPGRDLVALATTDGDRATAARVGGVLSHTSAALALGWPVAAVPEAPFITRPRQLPALDDEPDDAEVLRRRLPAADVDGWHTTPLRTVLDCARDLPFPEALAVADSALRSGTVTYDELRQAAHKLRGPARDRVRRVADFADERAHNPFESELRALCIEAGLQVIPQWEIRAAGLVLHPDMADPAAGVAVEADSWRHHGQDRTDWVRDIVRYNALVGAGWRVLRFTWEQVRFNKQYVVATLTAVLLDQAAS